MKQTTVLTDRQEILDMIARAQKKEAREAERRRRKMEDTARRLDRVRDRQIREGR